jgi:hypothetical protein
MLHWLYDPKRKIKRFVEENMKARPTPKDDPQIAKILELASDYGMRPSDVDTLAEMLEPSKLKLPQNDTERFDNVYYIMTLLLEDQNFDAAERDFVNQYAIELGYGVSNATFVIREMYNGLRADLPVEEIRNNVNQILN